MKGQSIGTITDIDGRFVLDAPKEAVLQITYIGYVSQEVKVSGKREINVVLKEDSEMLDEVVVVGYGTMKKKDLTGAVSQIRPAELSNEAPKLYKMFCVVLLACGLDLMGLLKVVAPCKFVVNVLFIQMEDITIHLLYWTV